jgi:hypothetical protein
MTGETRSLAWKEWHESRAYLWIALGVFAGLPLISGVEAMWQFSRRFEIETIGCIIPFGGVLAVFVAVGATCRDFRGHVEDFWRSRPMGIGRWMIVKYFIGLMIVLAGCMAPAVLQLAINRQHDATPMLVWFPCLWAAVYSIAFLIGCLVRRTAHAAMLGLAALMLVWFLPMILPPLRWLDVTTITDTDNGEPLNKWQIIFGPRQYHFAVGMIAITAVAAFVAFLAVRRGWRVESGRKVMYGSVATSLLILCASAAFQLGTNLPILEQIDLPPGETIQSIGSDAVHGYIFTNREVRIDDPNDEVAQRMQAVGFKYLENDYRTLTFTGAGIQLGDPKRITTNFLYAAYHNDSIEVSRVRYYIDLTSGAPGNRSLLLNVASLDSPEILIHPYTAAETHLLLWKEDRTPYPWAVIYRWRDRLYVVGDHLAVFDITEPLKPRQISNEPFLGFQPTRELPDADEVAIDLPPIPDLPTPERLKLALRWIWWFRVEGDTLCTRTNDKLERLLVFHLEQLTEASARFRRTGRYEPTMLEQVFGSFGYNEVRLMNGLLYMSTAGYSSERINPRVAVFDTRDPRGLRQVGHFAAPGAGVVCPLPDGRALVGGTKLYLIGPPPLRN